MPFLRCWSSRHPRPGTVPTPARFQACYPLLIVISPPCCLLLHRLELHVPPFSPRFGGGDEHRHMRMIPADAKSRYIHTYVPSPSCHAKTSEPPQHRREPGRSSLHQAPKLHTTNIARSIHTSGIPSAARARSPERRPSLIRRLDPPTKTTRWKTTTTTTTLPSQPPSLRLSPLAPAPPSLGSRNQQGIATKRRTRA